MIFARTRALRSAPNTLSPVNFKKIEYNSLGSDDFVSWSLVDDEHFMLCLVVGVIRFSDDASNLDYLILLTSSGIAYAFDDSQNGFWFPERGTSDDPKARSTRAWMNPITMFVATPNQRVPHARG